MIWAPSLGMFFGTNYAGGTVQLSRDGLTYESVAIATNGWIHGAWAEEIRCGLIIADTGGVTGSYFSRDGRNWINRNTSGVGGLLSVAWSPVWREFIAVQGNGAAAFQPPRNLVTDSGWTLITGIATAGWRSIVWADYLRQWVAVAQSGTDRVMRSENGRLWLVESAAAANAWRNVCCSNELGLLVAVGLGFASLMISRDARRWELITLPSSMSAGFHCVKWFPAIGRFIAVGPPSVMITSRDGRNWESFAVPAPAGGGSNGYFYAGFSPKHRRLVVSNFGATNVLVGEV
jgi:hypothetical protein